MGKFLSTKVYDGYSVCFRQWRAEGTACKFLHGYSVYFKVWYEGEMDEKNWVFDFGRLKRTDKTIDGKRPDEWLKWLLDHTVLIAEDDPELNLMNLLDSRDALRLRILPQVGIEQLAKFLYDKLNPFVLEDTNGRVKIAKIEVFEHEKNSGIYIPEEN